VEALEVVRFEGVRFVVQFPYFLSLLVVVIALAGFIFCRLKNYYVLDKIIIQLALRTLLRSMVFNFSRFRVM
jgi:hypothetical protein